MFPTHSPAPSQATLTQAQRTEAVASLHGYPPFRYLLEDLAEVVEVCLGSLAKAKTEAELLRAGRVYQVAFSFYSALLEHPQNLKNQIEAELALTPEDPFELTTLNPARLQQLQEMDTAARSPRK